jgi:biopolymer transport protein ExbD
MASVTQHALNKIRKKLRQPRQRAKSPVNADINVTPLIDVVLVLLIIFMVVTPMITSGVQVDLPRTSHHSKKPDDGKDIIISLTRNKEVYVNKIKIRKDDVSRVLEEEKRRNPEKTFYVKADNRTTWGAARELMEAINKAGINDVMLGTDEIKQTGPAH